MNDSTQSSVTLHPGSTLQDGKYRIEKVLGQGGFGITYKAVQTLLDEPVCVKEFFMKEYCLRDGSTSRVSPNSENNAATVDQYRTKFIKEARTIFRLSHPNIIKIYDVFMENETAYYVMEYIEGKSLAEYVRENGPFPEEVAVKYIRQIADALSFAHEHRIMHLDVKPANMMLRPDNQAILIDFGLAKQYSASGEQTSSTPVGISHGYAPVEQYKIGGVRDFSPETDVYALGASLYYLLCGKVPPQATDIVLEGGLNIPPEIPSHLRAPIRKAMSIRIEDRPRSIAEFVSLLDGGSAPDDKKEEKPVFVSPNNSSGEETVTTDESTVLDVVEAPIVKVDALSQPSVKFDGKKHPVVIAALWMVIVVSAILAVQDLIIFLDRPPYVTIMRRLLSFLFASLSVMSGVMMLRNRKLGFWLFCISVICYAYLFTTEL